jgi:adenosylcobyric acid synthase
MLGLTIEDPSHLESEIENIEGLGILPVKTTITGKKTTRQITFRFKNGDSMSKGYEIHMGETIAQNHSPLNTFSDGFPEGYMLNDRCWGTYIHGIFDNPSIIADLLEPFSSSTSDIKDFEAYKNEQFDKLAGFLRKYTDVDAIYQQLKIS